MLTRKVFVIKGQSQIQVQVMAAAAGQIIYFTLDELEKDDLPEELKQYLMDILPQIKAGRWSYGW
ncbi:hypothetical protein P9D43_20780 [Neobacillus niacini]|uniref:hypothetical protein n=1 Tax=Neobacillus niacini TaxID=86668 RepID=UPI00052FD4D3|nr:hypothetical protein [Neobacillus niacini]KGM44822.1 hypothetical protein NP83_09430 [Neobacillus niacini]MEC1524441.1 hypothetical protein [Neobacillus niacini]